MSLPPRYRVFREKWQPAVEDRIIQLRKNFNSGRATKNNAMRVAYRYARKAINRCKGDPDALEKLAVSLILTIDL
jgi:hypothetical protein